MKLKTIYCSIRRRFLVYFKHKYVKESLKKRKGSCNCGGICCERNYPSCPFWMGKRCAINPPPMWCRMFPIDEKEIELSNVKDVCGYYWKKRKFLPRVVN
jgi:hypothetical protein